MTDERMRADLAMVGDALLAGIEDDDSGLQSAHATAAFDRIIAEVDRLTAISALLWAEHKALTSVDLALEALPKGITLSLYEAYHDDWRSAHAAVERLKEAHDEA